MRASTTAAPRKFGLCVGALFVLAGCVSAWRGHAIAPRVCWGAGMPLLVLGALAPSFLLPVERAWMAMADVLGRVNTRLILSGLYVAVVTPVGALRRRSGDPLDRRMSAGTRWVRRPRGPVDPARYRQQF
jgi:hypothetical protein